MSKLLAAMADTLTGFLTSITGDHRYIHEGRAFTYLGNTGSLVAGSGTYSISILTPVDTSGVRIHFRPVKISATANTTLMTIAEGSVVTGGSAVIPFNRNRNIPKLSKAVVTSGVTVSTAGETRAQIVVGGGSNPSNNAGGQDGGNEELVLKPGTVYSVKIDNIGSTTASTGDFELFWYEEEK